jgi:hypothetical protein
MNSLWDAVAVLAVLASALNVTPQLVKSYRTKRTGDISFGMIGVIITGNVLVSPIRRFSVGREMSTTAAEQSKANRSTASCQTSSVG